jgi:hypothetical protein
MAQLTISPTNFLATTEPPRMCESYIESQYGTNMTAFTQPTGGALVRINEGNQDHSIYIFCDAPTHRLLLYTLTETFWNRTPRSVKGYGRQIADPSFIFQATPLMVPRYLRDSTGCFDTPIDVAVSSCGRDFDPRIDYIYVLDQANHHIVKLRYDIYLDSLVWVTTFGDNTLKFPTAIDYANYGDTDPNNDDIYVTDAGLFKVLRFSAAGAFETSYGGWGPGLDSMSFPTGIAVSTSSAFPNRIFVTDSHNHRVMRYYSASTGPIMAEKEYVFHLGSFPLPMIKSIDTDQEGRLYILDSFSSLYYGPDAFIGYSIEGIWDFGLSAGAILLSSGYLYRQS